MAEEEKAWDREAAMLIAGLKYDINPNFMWIQSQWGSDLVRLSNEILEPWFERHKNPPELLYHYTTADGLLGMLQSNRMWATDISCLNDASELVYAQALIQEELRTRLESSTVPILHEMYTIGLRTVRPGGGMRRYFVVCFCETDDLLSQWRAYGSRGGGYSVGFRSDELAQQPKRRFPFYFLRKVVYAPEEQKAIIATTLDKTADTLRRLTDGQPENVANDILARVMHFLDDHISEYLYCFKNIVFQEEREWRVVLNTFIPHQMFLREYLNFRSVHGNIVPYLVIDVSPTAGVNHGKLPIWSVTHGPTLHAGIAESSLRELLLRYDHPHATVKSSGVPLRFPT